MSENLSGETVPPEIMESLDSGPALRTIAMPADANPNGDIFGGWILSQMDLAGAVAAKRVAKGRVATVGIEAMSFHQPVLIGDEVSCFANVVRVGRTSIQVRVETWARRPSRPGAAGEVVKVTQGLFTFVAIDDQRRPRPVPADKPTL
ncbi:acyl-CoA thioesterase YciA [Azospirillum fermentarium]|nr:acyl-CoA thioesterase YciA [Azospirillum fermentarium]